jgi:hypothetical protein
MKKHNILVLVVFPLLVGSCVFAQKYMTLEELRNMKKKPKAEQQEVKKDVPKVIPAPPRTGMTVQIKQAEKLAEGSYSKIEKPFIFIARTMEDYAKISDLVEGFSSDKQIDFNKQAVVAAFAGMKNSGGYQVDIFKLQGRINVLVKKPPTDAMVTQAITYPYQIAIVDVEEESSLNVAFSDEFKNEMQNYTITTSEFEFEGGFIGRQTKFKANGTIGVLKYNNFITFTFDLKGLGNESNRMLSEMSSGNLDESNANITRVEAGSFIDRPHPPLNVAVNFTNDKLTMRFEPGKRDYIVNDGFVGRGILEAIKDK